MVEQIKFFCGSSTGECVCEGESSCDQIYRIVSSSSTICQIFICALHTLLIMARLPMEWVPLMLHFVVTCVGGQAKQPSCSKQLCMSGATLLAWLQILQCCADSFAQGVAHHPRQAQDPLRGFPQALRLLPLPHPQEAPSAFCQVPMPAHTICFFANCISESLR